MAAEAQFYLVRCREQQKSRMVIIVGLFTTPEKVAVGLMKDINEVSNEEIAVDFATGTPDGWSYDGDGLTWTVMAIPPDEIINEVHFSG